jgi:hypothetical protein
VRAVDRVRDVREARAGVEAAEEEVVVLERRQVAEAADLEEEVAGDEPSRHALVQLGPAALSGSRVETRAAG